MSIANDIRDILVKIKQAQTNEEGINLYSKLYKIAGEHIHHYHLTIPEQYRKIRF